MKKSLIFVLSALIIFVGNVAFAELNVSNCYGIYNDNVIDLREDGIGENVVNGKAVKYTILDLKVGDVFIDVDGNAKKVANIIRNGNEISIDTVVPLIDEVFQHLVIPNQEVDLLDKEIKSDAPRYIKASDGSLVTISPKNEESAGRGSSQKAMLGSIMKDASRNGLSVSVNVTDPTGSVADKAAKEGKKAGWKGSVWVTVDADFATKTYRNKVSPDFAYSKPTIKWKKVWFVKIPYPTFTTGHGTLILDFDQEVGYSFEFTGKGTISKEFPVWGTPNTNGAYAYVYICPSASFNVSVLYQRYTRTTYCREVGVEFVSIVPTSKVNKEIRNWSANGNYFQGSMELSGDVMIGVKGGVKVGGFTVFEARAQGGPYFTIHLGFDYASLNWSKGYEASDKDWHFQKYKDYQKVYDDSKLGSAGTDISISFGLKYNVNVILLNFVNWTPINGSFKIFELGTKGSYLVGKPWGPF